MSIRVKICGLSTEETVRCACEAGAAYVGFNFFPPSPRAISAEQAAALADAVPPGRCKTGLFVDPDDALLEATLAMAPLDMIQLHGGETPERVARIREIFKLPVMKVVAIAGEADLRRLAEHEAVADQILCDAKPRAGDPLPGGNGVAFDWRLIQGRRWRRPWMLAGGLTAATVSTAIRLTGAQQVDVSTGVEDAPGVKSLEKIRAFIAAAAGDAKAAPAIGA